MTIHPIILCGGTGSRLWPSSRRTFPKQFAPLLGDRTPYQDMLTRLAGEGFAAPVVATHEDFRFLAADQAQDVGIWDASVLVEPESRETAAAVLAAVLKTSDDPDALFLIAPVAHFAGSGDAFRAAILESAEPASAGTGVVFTATAVADQRFEASPVAQLAGLSSQGVSVISQSVPSEAGIECCTGMVLMRRADLIAAFETHAPELFAPCGEAVSEGVSELGFFRYEARAYSGIPERSFAADILDRCKGTVTRSLGAPSTDISDWGSLWHLMPRDETGTATFGEATAVDCCDSLLRTEEGGAIRLLGVGLENVVAVAMRDAVLVADRRRLDMIPGALERLSKGQVIQAAEYPRYHRPWGWYESLISGDRFQVKRIMVKPGGVLSLQSHVHRSEYWTVVQGTAEVTVDDETKLVPEAGSVHIPLGATHRMANPGKVPMFLIEVQTGRYLGEDDIKRYEDIYDRC